MEREISYREMYKEFDDAVVAIREINRKGGFGKDVVSLSFDLNRETNIMKYTLMVVATVKTEEMPKLIKTLEEANELISSLHNDGCKVVD